MIDTIKLNLADCEINSNTPIVIEPSPYDHVTQQRFINYDLFLDNSTGEIVQGKKAYLNTDKFNVTIKPKYTLETDEINKKKMYDKKYMAGLVVGKIQNIKVPSEKFNSGIFVQTSLPRYFNSTNYNTISVSDEKKVLKQLEKDLWSNGIKTNIWDSNLSRVDTFANIETSESFSSYSEIFELINLSRMQRFEYAGTTFLYKNGEHQICCYDKIFEMQNKNKNLPKSFDNMNVMRIENRLLKKRKIMSVAGISTLKNLYAHYDFIKDNFKSDVIKNIFKYTPKEIESLTVSNIKEDIHFFLNLKRRYWLENYLRVKGLESLLKVVSIDILYEAINDLEINRMQKSRFKKKIYQTNLDLNMMYNNKTAHRKTNRELYNELKTKFYKAVA